MAEKITPEKVMNSTEPSIRDLIGEVLIVEREYQYFKNLSMVPEKEKEIADRIKRLIERKIDK